MRRLALGFFLIALPALADPFAALEKKIGGRIGVFAVDTGSGHTLVNRATERFAMCSTFKLLLAAQVLHRVDEGKDSLGRIIRYGKSDLMGWAPLTSQHRSMTVGELVAAAVQYSDNTAANLLLRTQGGPAGLTAYLRELGDTTTHLDRIEPELNTPVPGKDLDTTTPKAIAETIRKLVVGKALLPASRERLENWLLGNTTGKTRLKAGLPAGWRIADKTGTGDNGATNDVGVLYPPNGTPIVVAAFVSGSKRPRTESEAALAEIARQILKFPW